MLPALLVFGPAFGAALTSNSIATLSGVSRDDAGLASGLNNTFGSTSGALGTAIVALRNDPIGVDVAFTFLVDYPRTTFATALSRH
jgi:predicted MFS family arabinose efflux permease